VFHIYKVKKVLLFYKALIKFQYNKWKRSEVLSLSDAAVLKKCNHCKIELPLNCFCKDRTTKDGFHGAYKTCKNEYYKNNKDKLFPKVDCSCGKSYDKYYLRKHLKTKYHNAEKGVVQVNGKLY
jgi:hypothetical protein